MSSEACNNIDWDGTQDMMRALTLTEHWYITKHSSSNCGVGATLVKWKHQQDDACPRCGQPEDSTHVYICTGQNALSTWDSNLTHLTESLTKSQTDPAITHTIDTSLASWRQYGHVPLHLIPPSLHLLVLQQTLIGWHQLLEGVAGTQWQHAQQDYCVRHRIQQSNNRWLCKTLVQLV